MKHLPKIIFKEVVRVVLLTTLVILVLFIGQKAVSEGPVEDPSQIYFYCLAKDPCTKGYNCPSGRDCSCLDQYIAKVRFNKICNSQPEGEVSGTCENCGVFGEVPEDAKNCALYGSSGEWIGWCGCKIVCPPTPTPTPSLPKDCGQRDAGFCEGGSCDYTSDPTDFCAPATDNRGRAICECTPSPTSTPAGTQGGESEEGTGDFQPAAPVDTP